LDAYEQERQQFEARLSEVLIDSGDAANQPEVARNPSTTSE
jgi:hypothetical protein